MRLPVNQPNWSDSENRTFWASLDWVYVRRHWRARLGMPWTGIKDVLIDAYLRRPPYLYAKSNAA